MARYPKRQKVKRYRRSFYTREMRLKKGIGIAWQLKKNYF